MSVATRRFDYLVLMSFDPCLADLLALFAVIGFAYETVQPAMLRIFGGFCIIRAARVKRFYGIACVHGSNWLVCKIRVFSIWFRGYGERVTVEDCP